MAQFWVGANTSFATKGREHHTVVDFASDLKAHGGDPAQAQHVCMDMSAAYAKGVALALPNAAIGYEPFHMIALAIQTMDELRRQELNAGARASGQGLQRSGPQDAA